MLFRSGQVRVTLFDDGRLAVFFWKGDDDTGHANSGPLSEPRYMQPHAPTYLPMSRRILPTDVTTDRDCSTCNRPYGRLVASFKNNSYLYLS